MVRDEYSLRRSEGRISLLDFEELSPPLFETEFIY